jgi:hypothetical protein
MTSRVARVGPQEGLRLYPPVPWIIRSATEKTTINTSTGKVPVRKVSSDSVMACTRLVTRLCVCGVTGCISVVCLVRWSLRN